MVVPYVFPNVPRLLAILVFAGAIGALIIATVVGYFLERKKEGRTRDVNTTTTSVPRKTTARKRDVLWLIILQVVLGGYVFYAFSTAPEYEIGPSRQEITNVKEELSHIKPRTLVLECADTDTEAGLGCLLINTFHYIFLDWPHTMDDPENGIMLPFKHAKGVKGLEMSPNDETTRAIKKAIEGNTKLTVKLLGRPYRGNTSQTIFLIIGSPP